MSSATKLLATTVLLLAVSQAKADSMESRCDIYPRGEDHATQSAPCVFSQRQGHITIRREDGVVYDLTPDDDIVGSYRNQNGEAVYRQSGLGRDGLIFRMPSESVYVYWRPASADSEDNPTAPYSTRDYDATTSLPCRMLGADAYQYCPAGILRMENREASIVVTSPGGEEFTFNFLQSGVNATGRTVRAELREDTWSVIVDNKEEYKVPLAAIEGG